MPKNRKISRRVAGAGLGLVLLAGILFWLRTTAWATTPVAAMPAAAAPAALRAPVQAQQAPPPSDATCRYCHETTEAVITFPSGETLPARVRGAIVDGSAHGQHTGAGLACTSCHNVNQYQFPHQPVTAPDVRSYALAQAATCANCHVAPHLTSHPGPAESNYVSCTDCHGAHNLLSSAEWEQGEGTAVCVDCHRANVVTTVRPAVLTAMIQDGLFTTRRDADYCLACHGQLSQTMRFDSGERVSISIDRNTFHNSVHGRDNSWQPLICTDCHEGYRFPHEPVVASGRREYALEMYTLCVKCHETKYESGLDDAHGRALEEGNENAAVCTDCHGSHYTPEPNEPRARISRTCAQCHSTIFHEYSTSIHGAALLDESNPDVPTCIDCHSVHGITSPTTAAFRAGSPELCARCHADAELMAQYDISTDVFNTYVADFHGTTVTLFEHQDPNLETNKAVCYDCHGVHNIKATDDPEAGIKANLLATCQQCHPNATANFSDAWTSHFVPSLEHNPIVFLVDWFYRIVIPATVGFFGFLVATDVYRRFRVRARPAEEPPPPPPPPPPAEVTDGAEQDE